MGTPEYMAPEQAAGKPADPRSDIYAVGSIMYEMLVGNPPYDGDNVMEVLHKKANELPRPVRSLRAEVPLAVEALVERAMARSPDNRPQTMRQLADEIRMVAASLIVTRADEADRGRVRDSPLFAGAIDAPMPLAALRLTRRGVATVGSAVLALLGGFVIVRAAMVPRTKGTPVVPAMAVPAPPPAVVVTPPPSLPMPEPEPEPFAMVGPPYDPALVPSPTPVETRVRRAPVTLSAGAARELLRTGQTLLRAQRYNEAAEAFRRLLPLRKERGVALIGLGNIAFQQRSYGDAVTRAKEALRAGGGVEARLLLGDAYFKLEKYDQAKAAYDEVLKLDPANGTARRGLELASRRSN
jgi:serine/threonine-protein kinase